MRPVQHLDLADCTEYRQALLARPPRIVHGTIWLLTALTAVGLIWAALTKAEMVIRASGRVRPVTNPKKVFNPARGEVLSAGAGGRVVEVNFREGDKVRQGELLIRLDTERLDNEIARRKRTIRSAEEELTRTTQLAHLLERQYEADVAKAEAESAQAVADVHRAKERHDSDVRIAEGELQTAQTEEARLRRLLERRAAAEADYEQTAAKARQAKEKVEQARLPVDEGRVAILENAKKVTEKTYAVKREELAMKQQLKQGELDAARLELANLELELRQAELRAPVDGVVTAGDVKVGDLLPSGKAVVEIAEQKGFIFEVSVPSEEVGRLQLDMTARIKLDSFDYQKYGTLEGRVCFISPDSGIAEGLRQPTYLVRIELAGDEVGRGEFHGRVKLGMAGQAEIITGREGLLSLLLKKIRQSISLS
jgi:multidrug efflux pump subunit AcrA (membrane-fusion protein)